MTPGPERPLWRRVWDWLFRWQTLLWLLVILLVWWALKDVPWPEVAGLLRQLTVWQILALVIVNTLATFAFGGRVWVLLRAVGEKVPLYKLTEYWLVGYAFSFFTPGPQFSGAPLQVYLMLQQYPVDSSRGTAAVTVSTALEGLVNAVFLFFGVYALFNLGVFSGFENAIIIVFAIILLAVTAGYLVLTWRGYHPATWLLDHMPRVLKSRPGFQNIQAISAETEKLIGEYIASHPWAVTAGLLVTMSITALMVTNAWLAMSFLGVHLRFVQIVAVLITIEMAVLFPTPGGLGAVEAAMVIVFQSLGYSSSQATAFVLLLRIKDIIMGGLGLLFGGWDLIRQGGAPAAVPSTAADPAAKELE
jgi:glycosyltransferase 2 family protein